jgi:ribA/ribD-fused uncharacterized protein
VSLISLDSLKIVREINMMNVSLDRQKEVPIISAFKGEYSYLSNFYRIAVVYDGVSYTSSEHAYQSAKAVDPIEKSLIQHAFNPREARKLGNSCILREDWDDVKLIVMHDIVEAKFSLPNLRRLLNKTRGMQLIEGNSWGDRFWGCELQNGNWIGDNNLGKLLMNIRDRK